MLETDMALYYNGISFVDVNTQTHITGPVKDQSGSDQLYTRITVKARTILNTQLLPATILDQGKDAGALLARVRHYLTQPRCPMFYDLSSPPVGGVQAFSKANAIIYLPDGRDDANGPWPDPDAISVTYTTPQTLEIVWACTVHLMDCDNQSLLSGRREPISIRWEDSISWDETWKATFRRVGTCIITSKGRYTIDWFRRYRINLNVCAGFRRTEAKYLVSKDGLRCDFTFTDVQLRFAPPMPAVKMKITQSETAPTQDGMRKGAVSVDLVGLQNANVVDLANWALIIMKARVWASNKVIFQGIVPGIMNLQTTETESEVSVQATCSYKVNPSNKRQTSSINSKNNWGVAVGNALGPSWLSPIGAITHLYGQSKAPVQPTQQVEDPISNSPWPWVGYGTSPVTLANPIGYASWANPYAAIQPPNQGVGMSEAVSLFAALLQDPCGRALPPVPNQIDTPPVIQIPNSSIQASQPGAPEPSVNIPEGGSLWNNPINSQGYPSAPTGTTSMNPPRPITDSIVEPNTGLTGFQLK